MSDQFLRFSSAAFPETDKAIGRFLELDDRGRTPKQTVYRALVAEQGRSDRALAGELFRDYEENAWRFARSFDGMDTMFDDLKSLGLKTGIISNGQTHIQLRSLLALNLDRLVDVYLISETEGLRKPDPEIFLTAACRLSADPTRCIFVGDSPEADMIGARHVGMKTIWFPNGAEWPTIVPDQPDAVITSLSEIGCLVRRWNDVP